MLRFYQSVFGVMWLAWLAYWLASSFGVKATARREPLHSRLSYLAPIVLAGWLLWLPRAPLAAVGVRFLPLAQWQFWAGAGASLTCIGLLFTVWARVHLGRNWSATVTIKQDHELVTSGPYGIVRHPIYTGLVLAFAGQALARGELRGLLAVALVFWGFWRKLRIEERWMYELFGDTYRVYSERVPALVPFVL